MERQPPLPVCRCFVLCRQLFHDPIRQDYALISPVHQIFSPYFPVTEHLAIFARWTNAHGAYRIGFQLRGLDGEVLSGAQWDAPFETHDPLETWLLPLPPIPVRFPSPGRYEVALLANGQDVATDLLSARLLEGPPPR